MSLITLHIYRDDELVRSETFSNDVIKIGRTGTDLDLDDSSVSRRHAVIEQSAGGMLMIIDLASSAGTYVNGKRVGKAALDHGDKIYIGKNCIVVDTSTASGDQAQQRPKSSPARYVALEIRTTCPRCGGGLPLNGPVSKVRCSNCQSELSPSPDFWKSILSTPDDDYDEGGASVTINFKTSIDWRAETPKCPQCKADFSPEQIGVDDDREITCAGCGRAIETFPAPAWLREALPSARQVYNGERDGKEGEDSGALEPEFPDGGKPVVLSCPQCKGALKVTAHSDRMVDCEFCGSNVYLPDDLWKRLHPVKTVSRWSMRFEGKSQEKLDNEKREEEDAARRRRDEYRKLRSKARFRGSWVFWALFAAIIFAVTVAPLLITVSSGDPLFGLAGKILCPAACDGCRGPMKTESWTTSTSDGTSTQFDFHCMGPADVKEDLVQVSDGIVFLFTMAGVAALTIPLAVVFIVALALFYRRRAALLKERFPDLAQSKRI